MDLYREEIMDHFQNPRQQGDMDAPDYAARESNASCGDMVEIQIKVTDGVIKDVKWKGIGCAISTAATSKLAEWLMGKKMEDVSKMTEEEFKKVVGFEVNPGRMKCLTLPVRAIKKIG